MSKKVTIGIEVELASRLGRSTNQILEELGWMRTSDGTVHGRRDSTLSGNEFRSPKITVDLSQLSQEVSKITEQFRKIVNSLSRSEENETAGIHFHINAKSSNGHAVKRWAYLFSKEFHDYLKSEYEKMATTPLEKRRLGTNTYNQFEYDETGTSRRRGINYKSAFSKHGTIEFRFFPTTSNPRTFGKYLRLFLKAVKKFEFDQKPPVLKYEYKDKDKKIEEIDFSDVIY